MLYVVILVKHDIKLWIGLYIYSIMLLCNHVSLLDVLSTKLVKSSKFEINRNLRKVQWLDFGIMDFINLVVGMSFLEWSVGIKVYCCIVPFDMEHAVIYSLSHTCWLKRNIGIQETANSEVTVLCISGGNRVSWCQLTTDFPRTQWFTCVPDVSAGRCVSYLPLWSWAWVCTLNITVCLFWHFALCTPVLPAAVDQECKYQVLWTVQAELSHDYCS